MQFSFKAQFVPAVAAGILEHAQQPAVGRICYPPLDIDEAIAARDAGVVPKRQTIRLPRKDGKIAQPGEQLHLCTGARTKAYRKLGITTCIYAVPISIGLKTGFAHDSIPGLRAAQWMERLSRYSPDAGVTDAIARADGFDTWQAMCKYFGAERHQVEGVMTWW